jgi:hypothetical protein
MIDHVMALFRVTAAVQDRVPDEDERPLLEGLSNDGVGHFNWRERDFKMADCSLGRDDGRGVDNNGKDVSVIVVRETQKEEARLGGNCDADFVSEFEAAAAFPCLFGDEDLDEGVQVHVLGGVEHAVVGDVAVHDLFPCSGEGCLRELFTTMIGQPVKHGDSKRFFLPPGNGGDVFSPYANAGLIRGD